MSKTTVTLTAVGMGTVPRGLVLVLQDGKRFVVRRQNGSTLTLVPYRWWHRVPWATLLCFVAGAAFGRLLLLYLLETFK